MLREIYEIQENILTYFIKLAVYNCINKYIYINFPILSYAIGYASNSF